MRYQRICRYVSETPWAITPEKMSELLSVLTFRAAGGAFTPEEIQAAIGAPRSAASASQSDAVAVIPLRGVIAHRMDALDEASGGTSVERFGQMFRAALADAAVGSILLDVDSPGGTVPGVQELATEMLRARATRTKRVVAVANSLMASAAYWLASSAADEIVAIPSAAVGSIGVFSVHEDLSERAKQLGIKVTVVSAGKYKTEGHPFEPLSDEAKAHVQARVDDAYEAFVKAVAQGRGVSPSAVRGGYGQGRVLGATDALAAGLIDRIDTFDHTIARLGRGRVGMQAAGVEAPLLAERHSDEDRRRRLEF